MRGLTTRYYGLWASNHVLEGAVGLLFEGSLPALNSSIFFFSILRLFSTRLRRGEEWCGVVR